MTVRFEDDTNEAARRLLPSDVAEDFQVLRIVGHVEHPVGECRLSDGADMNDKQRKAFIHREGRAKKREERKRGRM